jgi:hypothetical protein
VKFDKSVTGSVGKVPEKFGFDLSIFGWFRHFTGHVACEELGFRRNSHLRWEIPPEGAKNLQECSRNTREHKTQLDCTGFHRNSQDFGSDAKGGGKGSLCSPEQRGRRTRLLTEEGRRGAQGRRSTVGDGGHRWSEIAGGGVGVASGTERKAGGGEWEPLARSRAGGLFFKTRYGCTGQSIVPVRCTPDSAQ